IAAELAGGEGIHVRWRNGVREVCEPAPFEPTRSGAAAPGIRRGGVYLLTGGLGGLGRIFARALVSRYGARVVLAGRSPGGGEATAQILAPGNGITYVQADCSTPEGAHHAVESAVRQHGTLHGIFHAAGILRDGLLWNLSCDDLRATFAPKIGGLLAL